IELFHCQFYRSATPHHPTVHPIQFDLSMPQHRIGKLFPPSQQRSTSSCQLMKAERLQQAIIRAKVQTLHPFFNFTPPSQHQHCHLIEPPPHLCQHLGSIFSRKTQIHHHQIGSVLLRIQQSRFAVPHPLHIMPLQLHSLL